MVREERKKYEFWMSVARTAFAFIAAVANIFTASFIIWTHFVNK